MLASAFFWASASSSLDILARWIGSATRPFQPARSLPLNRLVKPLGGVFRAGSSAVHRRVGLTSTAAIEKVNETTIVRNKPGLTHMAILSEGDGIVDTKQRSLTSGWGSLKKTSSGGMWLATVTGHFARRERRLRPH